MDKTLFKVPKMDCSSEENLIRMKLEDITSIRSMNFDLSKREVTIYHDGEISEIEISIKELNLGVEVVSTAPAEDVEITESKQQRKILITVLIINFAFFLIEMTTGFISKSMGLVADSLDMLADSIVYGLSLYAVGGTLMRKKKVARLAGYFQITLAVVGFIEVLRRFFGAESMPEFSTMIIVSIFALIANGICLYLLHQSKGKHEAHMKASMIFTSNDVIINLGVITAGVLVFLLDSNKPDLIIGSIVFTIVIKGALRILKLGK